MAQVFLTLNTAGGCGRACDVFLWIVVFCSFQPSLLFTVSEGHGLQVEHFSDRTTGRDFRVIHSSWPHRSSTHHRNGFIGDLSILFTFSFFTWSGMGATPFLAVYKPWRSMKPEA